MDRLNVFYVLERLCPDKYIYKEWECWWRSAKRENYNDAINACNQVNGQLSSTEMIPGNYT